MADFRFYRLDGDGHVTKADWIEAKSDDEAIVLVRRMLGKAPFEIWERDRLVARVAPAKPDGDSEARRAQTIRRASPSR
jgi:hypothetical protein